MIAILCNYIKYQTLWVFNTVPNGYERSLLQWTVRQSCGGGGCVGVIRNWLPIWTWAMVYSIFLSAKSLDIKLICYIDIARKKFSIWNRSMITYLTYLADTVCILTKRNVLGQVDRMYLVWKIVFINICLRFPKLYYYKNSSFLTNTTIISRLCQVICSLSLRTGLTGGRIILCTIFSMTTTCAEAWFDISIETLITH